MRGESSHINKKHNESSKNVNILYLDMNNLYVCAIRQYLSINNFKQVKDINKFKQKLMRIKNNSSTGYVLVVDLEYLQELDDIRNDYPLAREQINIPKKWLSDYC